MVRSLLKTNSLNLQQQTYLIIRVFDLQNAVYRKVGDPFAIRLNNHRKDIKNPNPIQACKNIFDKHINFMLIEQLDNT